MRSTDCALTESLLEGTVSRTAHRRRQFLRLLCLLVGLAVISSIPYEFRGSLQRSLARDVSTVMPGIAKHRRRRKVLFAAPGAPTDSPEGYPRLGGLGALRSNGRTGRRCAVESMACLGRLFPPVPATATKESARTRAANCLDFTQIHRKAESDLDDDLIYFGVDGVETFESGSSVHDASDQHEEAPPPLDFYQLLNVHSTATQKELKSAYRRMSKTCHPDIAGDEATDMYILIKDAYDTLSSERLRSAYDEELQAYQMNAGEGYEGRPLSKWNDDPDPSKGPSEQRAIFIDECVCIGCTLCVGLCPETFAQDPIYGRARVYQQWGNEEDDIDAAIDCCPVDCIFKVKKQDLPVLEWCMTKAERVGVSVMLGGSDRTAQDPFEIANNFIKRGEERRARLLAEGLTDSAADGKWIWGLSDQNIAFTVDVKSAWNKLSAKTKQAWTFHIPQQEAAPVPR